MIKKTHTRNQKRMYRIHKQEEQLEKDKIIIAEQQIELDKYKELLDKIKKIINNKAFFDPAMPNCNALGQKATLDILKLLEEIE